MSNANIERKIIIGLIVSTDYLQQLQSLHLNSYLFKSSTAKIISRWCFDYFEKYQKAPFKDIEQIYFEQVKKNQISRDLAEEMEEEILPSLNDEYEEEGINVDYLLDKTNEYFEERNLEIHQEEIEFLLSKGKLDEAKQKAQDYKGIAKEIGKDINLKDKSTLVKIEHAFNASYQSVVKYPGKLGEFWNDQLVRGGFVGLFAPEKRGKTFLLIDMAIRACRQNSNVAFFQAGDMTESQALKRFCIYLAKKPDLDKYSGKFFIPVKDCIYNQLDICDKNIRECDFGVLEGLNYTERTLRTEITKDVIIEQLKDNSDYKPCHNCKEFTRNSWGTVWLKEIDVGSPLTVKEAKEKFEQFFIKKKKNFKLSTHANDTLSLQEIKNILTMWEKNDNFVPDMIVIDYADLLITNEKIEQRHKENKIWKGMRGLSQEKHCLVVTASQTDSVSYETDTIKLKNFSEDKRKYAHVTAMYGLNQDKNGREKKLGILRLNKLVVREEEFGSNDYVTVLQSLRIGRPFLTSY